MKSHMERTKAKLKKEGWVSAKVEFWNAFAKPFGKRMDLFGIIDVLAIRPGTTLGVQCCGGSGDASAHIKKALGEPRLWDWLGADNRFEIWAWRKIGPRGKAKRWQVRVIVFKLRPDNTVIHYETNT